MKKYLIINADDFGWDVDANKSTMNLFKLGTITSATIMTGMPTTKEAIGFALENQKKFSFGLHFNILDGHTPKSSPMNNTLVNKSGKFREYHEHIINSLLFKLKKKDIQKELTLQLGDLIDAGIKISHIDTHGHVHKFPPILLAMKPVLKEFNIRIIRCPQNIFQMNGIRKPIFNSISKIFFPPLFTPDYFFMLEHHQEDYWFQMLCANFKSGVTEIGIHPGTIDRYRLVEQNPFIKSNFIEDIENNDIKMINYHQVLKLVE